MVKLNEYAQGYETKATQNISELNEISTDLELVDDEFEFTDGEGNTKVVKQKVVIINEAKYRVPVSVIQQLKEQLTANKELKKFKVNKTGERWITHHQKIKNKTEKK